MAQETMTVVINADDNASGVIGNIGKSLGSLGSAATATVAGLTTATAAAVGGLAAAIGVGVSKAADLEQGVADIAAVMGLAADEVSPLKDLIQDLGMDPALKVNATEASDAIMQLAQSGISMTDILDGAARNVVLLSNATGGDMALSAAIASDAMTLFNISAEEMERAVNQITGVTVASKFGIVDYQYALANVGGVASTLGVSFEDLNTTIAAIAPSFSSGMEAGTALKTLFSRMVPASDDAADAMRDIGLFSGMTADEMKDAQKQATKLQAKIATLDPTAADFADQSAKLNQQLATVNESMVQGQNAFFNADGSMKSMAEIAGILQNAISGLSAEQKTATLTTIFGSDAIRASTALATVGAQAFTDLAGSIAQVDAAESAATRMNTFSGAMEVLQGVLDGLMIGIGDAFLPMLRSLIKTFTELIGTHGPRVINTFKLLADNLTITGLWLAKFVETGNLLNEKITDIDPNLRKFALAIDGIVQPIQSLTKQILSVIVQYELWKDVLIGLGIVLTVIALPAIATLATTLAPIIAAAVAVIAVVHLLRNAFESNFGGIRDFVMTATSMITGTFSQIQNGSLTLQEGIVQAFGLIVTLIGNYLPAWQSILVNWGQAIWQWIVDATPIALTKIIDWWTLLSKWVTDNSPAWFAQLQSWGGALWQWIVDSIPVALNMLGTWLGDLVYWIGDKLPTWGALFMSWQIMMVEWIANAIPDAIESLTDFVQGITKNGKDSENSLSRMIARWIKIFTEWMGTRVIPELGPMFLRFALAIGSAVLNILGELFRLGIVIGTEILFGIGQGLLNFVGLDTDLETLKSHIFLGLNAFIGGAESVGKGMINSLATGLVFPEALTTLNTNAGSIWSSIQTNIGDKVSDATTWGTGILTNLSTGLTGAENLGNWILTGISGGLSSSDHLRTLATAGDAVWQVIFGSIPAGSGGESLGQNIITSVSVGMSSSDHLRTLGSAGDNAWAVVTNSLPASSADTVGHGTLNAFSAGLSSSDHLRTLSATTDNVWDTLMQGLPYVEEPPKWGTGTVDNLSLGMQDESALGRLYANVELIWNGIVAVFVSATRLEEAYNWATTIITQLGYGIVSMIESFIAEVGKIWTALVNAFTSADKLKEAYNWGVGLITEIAKGAVSWITSLGTEIAKIWTALVNAFTSADKLKEAYNWGVGLITEIAKGAVSWITSLGTEIAKIWTALVNAFTSVDKLKEAYNWGVGLITEIAKGAVSWVDSFRIEIVKIWTSFHSVFFTTEKLKNVYDWGVGLITEIAKGAVSWITNFGTEIAKIWTALVNAFTSADKLTEAYNWGVGLISKLAEGAVSWVTGATSKLGAEIAKIWTALVNAFTSADKLTEAYNWGVGLISKLAEGAVSWVTGAASKLGAEIAKVWTALVNAFTSADKLTEAYNWGVGLISKLAEGAVSWVTGAASKLGAEIAKVWTAFRDMFISESKLGNVYSWGASLISKLAEGAVSWVTGATSKLGTEIAKIWTAFRNMFISEERLKEITDVGKNIIQGLVNGIVTKLNEMMAVGGTLQLIFSNLLTFIRGFFQEESPSKVMMRLGKNIMLGMEIGMLENTPNVIRAARQMAAGVMDATSGLSLDPQMSFSSFGSLPSTSLPSIGTLSNQDMMRPNVTTNNMTYNLSYETMRSAESIQQDIELLNLLYGGGRSA